MPKVKSTLLEQLCHIISEFGEQVFATDGEVLYCRACNKKVSSGKRFLVVQHVQTAKHREGVRRKGLLLQHQEHALAALHTDQLHALPTSSTNGNGVASILDHTKKMYLDAQQAAAAAASGLAGRKSQFSMDLCAAFIAADIPFWKLDNPQLRAFLEKYTHEHVPDESTLRKNYLPQCYEETLNMIRSEVDGKKIWVSIDETSDAPGRFVANVIIGTLIPEHPGKVFLLTTEVLEKTSHTTIARLFNDSLGLLWPRGVQHNDVLLFVTDATPYMLKAGIGLKILYPKMVHLTCLAHALHRVIEEVRTCFPDVDRLVSNSKKVFAKAPSRIQKFKDKFPEIPLPPQPVSTRLGTWLEAVSYYNTHFDQVREVVNTFASEEAAPIEITQSLLSMPHLKEQLAYVANNFTCLSLAIARLDSEEVSLTDALAIVEAVQLDLRQGHGCAAVTIKAKLDQALAENPGYLTVIKLTQMLHGQQTGALPSDASLKDLEEELSEQDVPLYAYAPVTSCDVERTFSKYKAILADHRRRFTVNNLKMNFVIHCNAHRYITNK